MNYVAAERFDKKIALDFVDEVACIGGSEEGLIHCILTGIAAPLCASFASN